MPQRKKAKSKKEMKKSINSLWKSLQLEKTKHAKASSIVGKLKQELYIQMEKNNWLSDRLDDTNNDLKIAYDREEHTTEVAANLIKEISNSQ